MIEFSDKGLYCPAGDFYIDPWRPVTRAVITHAHSDHARPGSGSYLCHRLTAPLLALRLGRVACEPVEWGEPVFVNGVRMSLHPAGHVIGSSQVRLEHEGRVWVVSGDYKTQDDGISGSFEPLRCHVFVTESTFALPIYRWKPQAENYPLIRDWVLGNRELGKTSVLIAYSLGKAQRVIDCLHPLGLTIFVHGAVANVHQALIDAGVALPPVVRVTPDTPKEAYRGHVVIAPPGTEDSPWMRRFQPYALGICSGWMQVRGNVRRRNADAGFALSDHADWPGLLQAVEATAAHKVYVTHGFQAVFSRYLNELGIAAAEVKTEYGEDEEGAGDDEKDGGESGAGAVATGAGAADADQVGDDNDGEGVGDVNK